MSVEHVRELHSMITEDMYEADCSNGECGHPADVGCPMVPTDVCRHCFDTALASEASKSEETVSIWTWPCPTIKALDKPAVHTNGGPGE